MAENKTQASKITLASSPNPSNKGQTVTFTGTVSPKREKVYEACLTVWKLD